MVNKFVRNTQSCLFFFFLFPNIPFLKNKPVVTSSLQENFIFILRT